MNKKGFTLIEVMAVIVVLGFLAAMITPVVSNLIRDSKDTLYKEQVDLFIKATKKYMIEHAELLPAEGDSAYVHIGDLISAGVIDNSEVIDPKTKKQMNGCVIVSYNSGFNQYEYDYADVCNS